MERDGLGRGLRFIDLFCGIGGFRYAADSFGMTCVFSSDLDKYCQDAYESNFKERPFGDITTIDPLSIPDHDVLLGGFPCQPFSIIGERRGFSDARGTLFFNIAAILKAKKPKAFVLENVKQLAGHNHGRSIRRIVSILNDLGYHTEWRVLNALDFGLPQKRERVFLVGIAESDSPFSWEFPPVPMKSLTEVLEKKVDKKHFASPRITKKRLAAHRPACRPAIWHENKSGNVTSYPFSCALRAGASYNYLLVDGKRRLTPREMLRLQGFPDTFKIVTNDHQTRKQAGNAVPVPMVRAVLGRLLVHLRQMEASRAEMTDERGRRILAA
jgi:DNA (cytosine-5)-methyltransferase 1